MSDRDSMTVTITLTQRDYAKALGAIQQQSPAKRILFWISIVFSVYMAYLLLRSSHGWLYATAGPVLLVVLIVGLGLLLRYWAARDFVRKNQDKLGPTQHEIGPDRITNHSQHGEGTLKWTAYYQIRETPDFFLLYTQSTFALIVPKRCFAKPDDVVRYREIVRQYYPGKKKLLA